MRLLLLGVLGAGGILSAAPPTLTSLFPAGAPVGATSTVTFAGKVNAGKTAVWVEGTGVNFSPPDGKGVASVTIAKEATPGLRLLRLFDAEGATSLRWFSIGVVPEANEVEPNDALGAGQVLAASPICVNGALAKSGDVDGFTIQVEAGRTLVALAEAYSLGSPVDAVINVYDEKGTRLATAHDGRNLDPVLQFPVPKAGLYTVQISGFTHPPGSEVRFTGGANVIYRLHLTTGPVALRVFPAAAGVGITSKVDLRGANLEEKETTFEIDGTAFRTVGSIRRLSLPRWTLGPLEVLLSAAPPALEREPNQISADATRLAQLGIAAGTISTPGDVDRFAFDGKKGERLNVTVRSKQLGLPLDGVLKIEAPDGKVLATADDQGDLPDPSADFTPAADGVYQAVVSDLFNKGGSSHEYLLQIGPAPVDLEATLTGEDAFSLPAGKSIDLAGKVKRLGGLTGKLVASVEGLPRGVGAECNIDDKTGDMKIKLTASPEAEPASASIRVSVLATESKTPLLRHAQRALRGEAKRGTSPLDTSPELWLTVLPATPAVAKAAR